MSEKKAIEHLGFVDEIVENEIQVRFVSMSACASCHAKGVCSASDMKDKEVWVKKDDRIFKKGESVNIVMKSSQGSHAVLIGYVYPFLAFLITLLVLNSIGLEELPAGLISLSILIPYFLSVYLLRHKINQKFSFSIRKYE